LFSAWPGEEAEATTETRDPTRLLVREVVRDVPLFFFQAEDGIRGFHVTGVQTCALPISITLAAARPAQAHSYARDTYDNGNWPRSEERRVGKECRCRWWAAQYKKNGDVLERHVQFDRIED